MTQNEEHIEYEYQMFMKRVNTLLNELRERKLKRVRVDVIIKKLEIIMGEAD